MLSELFKSEVKQMKTVEEVHEAWDFLKLKHRTIQAGLVLNFDVGDGVSFFSRGMTQVGKVTKVNQKTVSVLVGTTRWKCSPNSLKKVE